MSAPITTPKLKLAPLLRSWQTELESWLIDIRAAQHKADDKSPEKARLAKRVEITRGGVVAISCTATAVESLK